MTVLACLGLTVRQSLRPGSVQIRTPPAAGAISARVNPTVSRGPDGSGGPWGARRPELVIFGLRRGSRLNTAGMREARLNLAGLRRTRIPGAHGEPDGSATGERLRLSRRTLFGMAGAATLGLSSALEAVSLGRFTIARRRHRVAFWLAGQERWVVDARRFGGRPRLTLDQSGEAIRLELAGALLPGTTLSADFVCDLMPALAGWRMRLRLVLGGLETTVPFERWLAGLIPAAGALHGPVSGRLGPGAHLEIPSWTAAEFAPDWSLRLSGSGAASLTVSEGRLAAEAAEISLLGEGGESLLDPAPARRTLISFERGGASWSLGDTLPRPPFGRLVSVIVSGPREGEVDATARALGRARPSTAGLEVLGPAPAALSLLRGRHRRRFLVKADRNMSVQPILQAWLAQIRPGRAVRIQVDVDPLSFL